MRNYLPSARSEKLDTLASSDNLHEDAVLEVLKMVSHHQRVELDRSGNTGERSSFTTVLISSFLLAVSFLEEVMRVIKPHKQ